MGEEVREGVDRGLLGNKALLVIQENAEVFDLDAFSGDIRIDDMVVFPARVASVDIDFFEVDA